MGRRGTVVTVRHVQHYTDQHGKERWYFRKPGRKKVALPNPRSPEFMAAYQRAVAGIEVERVEPRKAAPPGSIGAAVTAYYQHNSFTGLAPTTRGMRRAILERFRANNGHKSIAAPTQRDMAKFLGSKKPFAARNWLKTLRGLMQFAVAIGLRDDDPTAGIKLARAPKTDGLHTWTEVEIARYEAVHPIGTRARLAMALMLYTAARLSDAAILGPQHIRDGVLSYRQKKTGRHLSIPVHPDLAAIIAATPSGHLTFVTTQSGKGFTSNGLGNMMRAYCDAAGLPICSSHGLRKATSRRLAEAGCSASQIQSITGHKTLSEVQRYTAAADQARLARDAIEAISGTPIVPPSGNVRPIR